MKKKSVILRKKLFLHKEILAKLNARQQELVKGGAAPSRRLPCVTQAGSGSCNTMPPMQDVCILC